jgi:hypothetical protein
MCVSVPQVCASLHIRLTTLQPYNLTTLQPYSLALFGLSWSQEPPRIGSDGALGDTAVQ